MEIPVSEEDMTRLINVFHERYGYDFSGYSRASFKRRIKRLITLDKIESIEDLGFRLVNDDLYAQRFIGELMINVTEMFRDPSFFRYLRNSVLPVLNTYPLIRIWHAGCSTGEEVYSMAILLKEENLYHKTLLYATDINPVVVDKAKKGIFPLAQMKTYSENYIQSGGREEFSTYYSANYENAKFDASLAEKIIFAAHNLAADKSFNEFNLIICRNVMIYFDKELQETAFTLFDQSLAPFGFIALGSKETLRFSPIAKAYRQLENQKIWRKS